MPIPINRRWQSIWNTRCILSSARSMSATESGEEEEEEEEKPKKKKPGQGSFLPR